MMERREPIFLPKTEPFITKGKAIFILIVLAITFGVCGLGFLLLGQFANG